MLFPHLFSYASRQATSAFVAKGEASQAMFTAQAAASKIAELEHTVNRMLLINRAMWELMQERLEFTNEQLTAKVNEIDLRDGTPEEQYEARKHVHCPGCGRTLSGRHGHCIYCGAALPDGGDAFDLVK